MYDVLKLIKDEDQIDSQHLEDEKIKHPEHLIQFSKNAKLMNIIKKFQISRDDLEQLITLSQIVEPPEQKTVKKKLSDTRKMIPIPKGNFIYQDNEQRTIDHDYEIDIYPVTNQAYKEFIIQGGYSEDSFWDKSGKEWKNTNKVVEPRFFQNEKYNDPEQPVVGVRFYEALAYTKWLSEKDAK